MISLDWSHGKPLCIFDGKDIEFIEFNREKRNSAINALIKISSNNGKIIATENIPNHYARQIIDSGVSIHKIHPNTLKIYRDNLNIEKSDENDAIAIFDCFNEHPEYFRKIIINPELERLRDMVKNYYDIQELRKKIGNRQFSRGDDIKVIELEKMETSIKNEISKQMNQFPIYNDFFEKVKGVGPMIAANFISYIDIHRAHNPSAVIKYCGMGVTNGKADGRKSGQTLNYNPRLKTTCFLLGDSFIKHRSPKYRELYDRAKQRYQNHEKYKNDKPGHINNMAMRIPIQIFLHDMHSHWRKLEGLEVVAPYPMKMLGHKNYITDNPEKLEIIELN